MRTWLVIARKVRRRLKQEAKPTCLSTLQTRPNILMSSKMSPSDSSFSRIFLSSGIWPFPRIWSTLGHTYTNTNTQPRTSICTNYNVRKRGGGNVFVFFPVKSRKPHITLTHVQQETHKHVSASSLDLTNGTYMDICIRYL